MKRHISLIPLSHEHHGALILARLLQKDTPPYKGLPADVEGKAGYAFKFYNENLVKHFELEEKIIPFIKHINPELDDLLECMVKEHVELRQLFKEINSQTDLPAYLDVLGKNLEAHVRKEERRIFPLIQDNCSTETLSKLELLLSAD